jgi:uncharacterized protein (DUF2236 family)
MLVTRVELEAEIERLCAEVRVPAEGIFGPASATWQLAKDGVVFLGAGRAALLQLAHPYVAHAIEQHSTTRHDPVGRFNRTFLYVYGMIFGDLEGAVRDARRVRAIHDRVSGVIDEDAGRWARGHVYTAHEADALRWVFATLVHTTVVAHEIGYGPLPVALRDGYYLESKRFARLFGLADAALPPDWAEFSAYVERTMESDELAVGRPAREIATFLLSSPSAALAPVMRWYRRLTAGMLPVRLREAYGLSLSAADAAAYDRSLRTLRRTWPLLPERARLRPEYVEATRRLAGAPRPDRLGRALQKAILRAVRPTDA